jgi:hypothetical protein
MSSIAMTGQVLGVALGMLQESPEMARRRQARADNQTRLAGSREKHLKLAVKLPLGGPEATALKRDALRMVKLWQDGRLCSPVYIARWRKILNATPLKVAQSLATMDDEWSPVMRQNTALRTKP